MKELSLTDLEQAIKQVKSVNAARIRADQQGEIEEIHVLASAGRNPKQVVRDIESVLAAQFDLQIDHKKISVVQFGDEEEQIAPFPEYFRPRLVGVTMRTVNTIAEVVVELSAGEQTLQGVARGHASTYNRLRLVVEATLNAVETLTGQGCAFVAEDVVITQLAKRSLAQVAITLIAPGGELILVGCALVRSDDREAVVRATLDARNRKLTFAQNT
ncbi:MAG TPA: hypothetical protein VHQ46_00695 [Desulfobacteria bacterium]|nr:hypothetical protein [Desulfobacteria bacterium]